MKSQAALLSTAMMFSILLPRGFSSELPDRSNATLVYDVNREQRIAGLVEAVGRRPGGRALAGAYLTLLTPAGKVEVHLGPAEVRGEEGYGLRAGDQIEVTGCVVAYNGLPVLLARLVKRGNQILTFRTKLGFPITSRGIGGSAAAIRTQ
jgi:hypothetical protein